MAHRKGYLIMARATEYNDEYTSFTEHGGDPAGDPVFFNKQAAMKRLTALNDAAHTHYDKLRAELATKKGVPIEDINAWEVQETYDDEPCGVPYYLVDIMVPEDA
jgi:hypothetical protein